MKKILIICVSALLLTIGFFIFEDSRYMLISMLIAVFSCIPFFIRFEKRDSSEREIVMVAVMTALTIAARFVFAAIAHFKPVTAIVIITGMYFGADAGFVTGAFTALISNFYYGQGPWTPFQMAIWGIIGFAAGIINRKGLLDKNKMLQIVFSALTGVIYSIAIDIVTTLESGEFSIERYFLFILSSLPVMATYAVSNVIFILVLQKPIGKRLKRLKTKYGVYCKK